MIRTNPDGKEARMEVAYIRGSQINFIVLPSMLQKAPFFNRIKMWRKFKGNAVFGANTLLFGGGPPARGPPRGVFPGRGPMPGRGFPPGPGVYGPGPNGPPMPFMGPGGGLPRPPFPPPGGGYPPRYNNQ